MFDISISATKVNGRPKGRPKPFSTNKHSEQIVYPNKLPYTNTYLNKIQFWQISALINHKKHISEEIQTFSNVG